MEIQTMGKQILTEPIRYLLTQGEHLADRITFVIDRQYQNRDLSAFLFRLRGKNRQGAVAEQMLTVKLCRRHIRLVWTVTEEFTVADGPLKLEITGFNSDLTEIIKYSGEEIFVKTALDAGALPDKNLLEQLLLEITAKAERAQQAAKQAEQSAAKAQEYANQAGSTLPATTGFVLLEDGVWDFNRSDKAELSDSALPFSVLNLPAGGVGLLKAPGDIVLPENSRISADFAYLSAGEGEGYLYSFVYDGQYYYWSRTVYPNG